MNYRHKKKLQEGYTYTPNQSWENYNIKLIAHATC